MASIVTPKLLAHRAEFYQQLASLLSAGVGMLQALDLLHRSPPARSFRQPIAQVRRCIQEGHTFAESLARQGRWLPPFDLALVHAGEQAGRLAECCRLLSGYYEERSQLIRQVLGNLAYPLVVLHLAIVIFPTSQLVALLQHTSLIEFGLAKLSLLLPAYAAAFAFIYLSQAQRAEPLRSLLERACAWIPVLGTARRHLALARLSAALEALISAGVTMIEGWELAANASGSPAIRRTVHRWRRGLESGQTPAELLAVSPAFPELFSSLYATGELSGQLDETLRRLHRHYQEEASRKLQLLARWVPLLVYFAVMLVIAYQIVVFWMGYFRGIGEVLDF
jgi:type II secretory pathway component PulF